VSLSVYAADDASRRINMTKEARHGILDDVGPRPGSRRGGRRPSDTVVKLVGLALLAAAAAAILAGPSLMSTATSSAIGLFGLLICAAYGIFMAAHSRSTHVDLERAYSAHLEELSQRLRTMAYRDALTGLYNHRYFYEQLSHEVERAIRYGQPLAVLLMDMNNFKQINDSFGHILGDKCLSIVGQVIATQIRGSDIGARYGGDEFVVILPNTGADEAAATARKLEAAVTQATALGSQGEDVKLGIAIGMAVCPDDSRSAGELLHIADKRLYEVKARIRGRGQPESDVA
jgi:diguanylate cyclase (GGDEF)-like protein